MKTLVIEGGHLLEGEITIGGAKNGAVALIPAALLSDEEVTIENVPNISDIDALIEILEYLGAKVISQGTKIKIDSRTIENKEIPESISTKLRASYYFMAALLGKFKKVVMYFPGGCNIGKRPIDQTLKAFSELGATIIEEDNKYTIFADELIGNNIYLDMPSVGATINALLSCVKAKGRSVIENAAKEPEIVNVATFLNNMGASITGAGTSRIIVDGVSNLKGSYIEVIPDRIEAGTYILAGALIGNNLKIKNVIPRHLEALTMKLKQMGASIKINKDFITVSKTNHLKPVSIKTLGYPGFPTDLQQPMTVLLCMASGLSKLEETIYENRFQNVTYLNKMGANIEINDNVLKIKGPTTFVGCDVLATDLRAGACMLLAGLVAKGQTRITKIEHILRGYENLLEKLKEVGAKIEIIE